jgi:hypothetical protein
MEERKTMRTFDGFMVALAENLFDLKRLSVASPAYQEKQRQVGRYCYEAEEYLLPTELRMLKGQLGITERAWRRYKDACIAGIMGDS